MSYTVDALEELERRFVARATLERTEKVSSRRSRRMLTIALAAALLVATAAGAATHQLDVGSLLPTSKDRQRDGLRYYSDHLVVAAGTTERAGRWQLLATTSSAGDCLGLRLPDILANGISEGCGIDPDAVAWRTESHFTLAFGQVGPDVASIELRSNGGVIGVGRPIDDPRGEAKLPRYFLIEGPPNLDDAEVVFLDRNQHVLRRTS